MKFGGFAKQSRHLLDTRIGIIFHSDRMNVLLSDRDERSSRFNFGITLCVVWWNIGFTVYL